MICPQCHRTVPDDAAVCPHCSAYLGESAPHASQEFIFCEGCGARLSPKDRSCPKCGRPAPGILSTEASAADLAAGKTASFPKLTDDDVRGHASGPSAAEVLDVSLDPSATNVLSASDLRLADRGEGPDPYHRKKRPVGKVLAAVLALALVGGAAYFVAMDPLGVMPAFYAEVSRQAAEMFPSRQGAAVSDGADAGDADASGDGVEVVDTTVLSGEAAFDTLTSLYEQIGDYQDPLSDVIDDYNSGFLLSDLEARRAASESAYTLRDQVQATLDAIDAVRLEQDSPYAEDLEHIRQLATWMYNRVDVLCDSWDISLGYPDGERLSQHQSEISKPLRDQLDATGHNENLTLFEENYADWRPTRK